MPCNAVQCNAMYSQLTTLVNGPIIQATLAAPGCALVYIYAFVSLCLCAPPLPLPLPPQVVHMRMTMGDFSAKKDTEYCATIITGDNGG